MERTALEHLCLNLYWTSLFPHGRSFPAEAALYSTTNWTSAAQSLSLTNSTVHLALLANALGVAGRQNNELAFTIQGLQLYSAAMQALARSLHISGHQNWGALLTASGLLAGHEVSYVFHQNGNTRPVS